MVFIGGWSKQGRSLEAEETWFFFRKLLRRVSDSAWMLGDRKLLVEDVSSRLNTTTLDSSTFQIFNSSSETKSTISRSTTSDSSFWTVSFSSSTCFLPRSASDEFKGAIGGTDFILRPISIASISSVVSANASSSSTPYSSSLSSKIAVDALVTLRVFRMNPLPIMSWMSTISWPMFRSLRHPLFVRIILSTCSSCISWPRNCQTPPSSNPLQLQRFLQS